MTQSITEQRKAMVPGPQNLFDLPTNGVNKVVAIENPKDNSKPSHDLLKENSVEQPEQILEKFNSENKNKKTDFLQKISVILKNPADYKEYIEKMKELKQDSLFVQFKYGSLFYQLDKEFKENFDESIKQLFKDSNFKLIKRTQAFKYAKAYELCLDKHLVIQSTERLEKLGIEKAYLITTLNNPEQTESLIKCTLNQNMTVKQLEYEIELLNQNIKENVNRAYDEIRGKNNKQLSQALAELKGDNQNKKQKKVYTEKEYNVLEEKYKLLEQRNKELEQKLQQYESAKILSVNKL